MSDEMLLILSVSGVMFVCIVVIGLAFSDSGD